WSRRRSGGVVVMGPAPPRRGGGLQPPPARDQPGAGEIVVGQKARELVPALVDGVDLGFIGALELALELEVIRRIGEYEVDAGRRQRRQLRNAVADEYATRFG